MGTQYQVCYQMQRRIKVNILSMCSGKPHDITGWRCYAMTNIGFIYECLIFTYDLTYRQSLLLIIIIYNVKKIWKDSLNQLQESLYSLAKVCMPASSQNKESGICQSKFLAICGVFIDINVHNQCNNYNLPYTTGFSNNLTHRVCYQLKPGVAFNLFSYLKKCQ